MAAMGFVSLPFLINAARTGFEAVPQRLEKCALTLGASPLRVFLTISLPLARRSLLTGMVMMFSVPHEEMRQSRPVVIASLVAFALVLWTFAFEPGSTFLLWYID